MSARTSWLVFRMDDGLLRREPTRRAAIDWAVKNFGGEVVGRHTWGVGDYDYQIGLRCDGPYGTVTNLNIVRADRAGHGGWNIEAEPWYPHPDQPYQRRDNEPETRQEES